MAVLLLAETARHNRFRELMELARNHTGNGAGVSSGSRRIDGWSFHRTNEACSLYASAGSDSIPDSNPCSNPNSNSIRAGSRGLFIIAGRQVVSTENLEILALGVDRDYEDRKHPLKRLAIEAAADGAIPVAPWGPGKWWGSRGKAMESLLRDGDVPWLFLGDNGGRPVFWPDPHLFELARARGIKVLPGSDPLPFPSQSGRAGSFGFTVPGMADGVNPARDIKAVLRAPATQIKPYGRLEHPLPFFRNQLAMQVLKRRQQNSMRR